MTTKQIENLSIFKELLRRRVFQIVGVYLGSIFALVEFTGNLVERYHFADYIIDLVLAGMILMIPAVIILAWRHGAPGKDDWTKIEKIGIPVNLIITLSILLLIVPEKKSTSINTNSALNANQSITESINKKPVTRVKIFFTDHENITEENQWLSYGFSYLISTDLAQNREVAVQSFYDDIGNNNFWLLRKAGYKNGLNIPLGLAKSVATNSLVEFFTQSKFTYLNGQLQLSLSIFKTNSGEEIANFSASDIDPYKLSSQAARFIQENINPKSLSKNIINRVPIKDLVTGNTNALEQFISAMNYLLFDNNFEAAKNELKKAVNNDRTFALAYFKLANISSLNGESSETKQYIQKVLNHSYKLTDRTRFKAKAESYRVSNQIEQQNQVYRSWIELYESDHTPKNLLANSLLWQGNEIQQAISLLEQSLQVNPNQPALNNRLGDLYFVVGNREKAINYYQTFYEHSPNSYLPLVSMGNVEKRSGNLNLARKYYQKASVVSTDMVTPVLSLGDLDLREGKLIDANKRIDEARIISQAPRQQSLVYKHQVNHLFNEGKPKEAFLILQDLQNSLKQFEKPLDVMIRGKLIYMHLYVSANKEDIAIQELDALEPQIEGLIKELLNLGYALLYVSMGEAEKADTHLTRVKAVFDKFKVDHQQHVIDYIEGFIYYIKKDYVNASKHFIASREHFYKSVISPHDDDIIPFINLALVENLRLSGENDKALHYATEFLNRWPMNAFMNYQVTLIHMEKNKKALALEHLNKTLDIWRNAERDYPNKKAALELKELLERN